MSGFSKIYAADFETRAGEKAIAEGKTWVWAWAICPISDIEKVEVSTTIDGFWKYIQTLGNCIIYFHNLKFDASFILYYLLFNGYTYTDDRKPGEKQFTMCMSDSGALYTVKVRNVKNKTQFIEFRDSLKKIPGTIAGMAKSFGTKYQKLSIDYCEDRLPGQPLTREEVEYIKNDVRILGEALHHGYKAGMDKITIGSDCMAAFKEMIGGNGKFRKYFPDLREFNDQGEVISTEEHDFAHSSYKGGVCMVNPIWQGKLIEASGVTHDVRSLYPSMMHSTGYYLSDGVLHHNVYPYGKGKWFDGKYKYDSTRPLYIVRFKCCFKVKEGMQPTVQLKGNFLYGQTEYIRESAVEYEGRVYDEPVEMTMTSIDLEVFLKHYDIIDDYIEWIGGYCYKAHMGFFDKYVDRFFKQKSTSEGAKRQQAKLYLNNLYGKFAQKITGLRKIATGLDRGVKFQIEQEDDRPPLYMPIGTFITAYARRFLFDMVDQLGDRFCYCDTDSIHYVGESVTGPQVDGPGYSQWVRESNWDRAIFIRQKTYYEHVIIDEHGNNVDSDNLKCAGMDSKTKGEVLRQLHCGRISLTDLKPGFRLFYENGEPVKLKLRPMQVEGGCILVPQEYVMH